MVKCRITSKNLLLVNNQIESRERSFFPVGFYLNGLWIKISRLWSSSLRLIEVYTTTNIKNFIEIPFAVFVVSNQSRLIYYFFKTQLESTTIFLPYFLEHAFYYTSR